MNPTSTDQSRLRLKLVLRCGIIYILWLSAVVAATYNLAPSPGISEWIESWLQWDALWYQKIWLNGYALNEIQSIAFPPGFALIVGSLASGLSWLTGTDVSFALSAMLINTICFFAAMFMATKVLSRIFNVSATWLFALSLMSPVSYFALPAYSDTLFCLILWTSLDLALPPTTIETLRESIRRQVLLGIVLGLAPWIRLTGFAFASWTLLKRWSALSIFASLAGWLFLNWSITGDPLKFLHVQTEFGMPTGGILSGLIYTLDGLLQFPDVKKPNDVMAYAQFHFLPLLYFLSLFATSIWMGLRRHYLLALTVLSVLLISHNQAFWRSVLRYNLPLLPCLYVIGLHYWHTGKGQLPRILYRTMFVSFFIFQFALQILFARRFVTGAWAF